MQQVTREESGSHGGSVGEKIRRNTRSSFLAWGFYRGLKLISLPIVIAFIHKEGYALVDLAYAFVATFSVYNFGINIAYTKYTAECHAKGDYRRLEGLLGTGMAMGLCAGVALMAVLWVYTDRVVDFFNVDAAYQSDARFVVICIGLVTAATMTLGVYRAALFGIQRIDLTNYCGLVFSGLEFAAIIPLLYMGYGVRAVVAANAANIVGGYVAMAWLVRRHLPGVRISPFRAGSRHVIPLFSLGGRMQLLGMTGLVLTQLDKLFFQKFEGLAFLGTYVVAKKLVEAVQSIMLRVFGALEPASADMHARDDEMMLRAVYASAMRITAVGCAYFLAFTAVNSDMIIRALVGNREYDPRMAHALLFLSGATLIHTLTGPGGAMLRGTGKPLRELAYQGCTILFSVTFFALAQRHGGDVSIMLSFPAGLALASMLFIFMSNRYFGEPLSTPFGAVLPALLAGPLIAWILRAAWAASGLEDDSRWLCLVGVGCMGVIYTVLFSLVCWFLPGLTPADREQLIKFVPMGERMARRLRRTGASGQA